MAASDDAYAAFLNKANQDPSGGYASTPSPAQSAAVDAATKNAPAALVAAVQDVFYMSDSDEPFSAVALPYSSSTLPDEDTFVSLALGSSPGAEVTIMDPFEWDPKGRYKQLLDAVREAGHGNDVRVYRVQFKNASQVEYWLVTVDEADDETDEGKDARGAKKAVPKSSQLVGVKALSIES
ncbi:hypothetical protein CMQ_4708 [Grosmannia clavigera kw1407]|uniref:Uncharacterized protein n=1 Tax=Grosmannia clavigera (strain kw1407 / UAMH 11150) TaxID=655863 RepID=F0XTW6_GROCL|nr:uncharacterized protein CMQ_4708 [Grosmannia clavigera kw1407]EFW98856.1 hypothetical protein CMQ_4708 [Grosmannia clavigera kw1407]